MSKDVSQTPIEQIIQIKNNLPRKQRELCDYILKNHHQVSLMTIKELAENANVGISTVMRVLNALGYTRYNDLRKDLHEERMPSSPKWTLKRSLEIEEKNEQSPTIVNVWKESIHLLNNSLQEELLRNFDDAINIIENASFINVLGTRPYKAVALYFEQLLGEFHPRIRQLSNDTELVFDKILQLEQEEILLVFAFEPYTNRVIDSAKLAHKMGNKVILITDYISCPVAPFANVILELEVSDEQFSIVPIVALVDALVIEFGKRTSKQSIEKLKLLEQTLIDNQVTYE